MTKRMSAIEEHGMTPAGIAALMVVADRVATSFADDGTAEQRDIDRLIRAGFLVRTGRSRFEFGALGAIAVHLSSQIASLSADLEAARGALEQSVKFQSHYAAILNDWDGGKRMVFANADAWMDRLRALKDQKP